MNNTFVKLGVMTALSMGFLTQAMLPASAGEVPNRFDMQQPCIHAGERGAKCRVVKHATTNGV